MNRNKQISNSNINNSKTYFILEKFRFILVFLIGVSSLPIQPTRAEEIYLTCTGKFEINRGELIKPDWETSYLTINLDELNSYIDDKGIKKEGITLIRRNKYTIIDKDNNNRIRAKYKIDGIHGTYIVEYPQQNKKLIGTCQKGRG
tara:strand:- start:1498 stop:1935 length:438 start_codon:yes stop_codon:yes gene_type:complete